MTDVNDVAAELMKDIVRLEKDYPNLIFLLGEKILDLNPTIDLEYTTTQITDQLIISGYQERVPALQGLRKLFPTKSMKEAQDILAMVEREGGLVIPFNGDFWLLPDVPIKGALRPPEVTPKAAKEICEQYQLTARVVRETYEFQEKEKRTLGARFIARAFPTACP